MRAQSPSELDLLSTRLSRAQTEFERALSRGDDERVQRCRLQISAINAERDWLMKRRGIAVASGAAGGTLLTPG